MTANQYNAFCRLLECAHARPAVWTGEEMRRDPGGRVSSGNYWDRVPLADVDSLDYGHCSNHDRDTYTDLRPADWPRDGFPLDAIVMLEYCTYSDYSGGTVERANYKAMSEDFAAPWLKETYGGHGTTGLAIDVAAWLEAYDDEDRDTIAEAESILEAIEGLEDYPLYSEDAHGELEMELENEALPDVYREIARSVDDLRRPRLEAYLSDLPEDVAFACYRVACEETNTYAQCEDAVSAYIDVKRIRAVYLREAIARRHSHDTSC
jgi:hypothetical protein